MIWFVTLVKVTFLIKTGETKWHLESLNTA